MTYGGWKPKRHEHETDSGVKRGYRILVAVTRDDLTDIGVFADSDDLDGMLNAFSDDEAHHKAAFRKAFVDEIGSASIRFTLCNRDGRRSYHKGELRLSDEGTTWVAGWGDNEMAVLRATYNLS